MCNVNGLDDVKCFLDALNKHLEEPLLPSKIDNFVSAINQSVTECGGKLVSRTDIMAQYNLTLDPLTFYKFLGAHFIVEKYFMTLISNKDLNRRLWEEFAKDGISFDSYSELLPALNKMVLH